MTSFNPRSREGNDIRDCKNRRCRTGVSIHVPARGTTESTTPKKKSVKVSIHVPARGTTISPPGAPGIRGVSIHVPARGTTRCGGSKTTIAKVSIHVPARGTTRVCLQSFSASICFNPRSREGNDLMRYCSASGSSMFQSTFPRGERREIRFPPYVSV